MKILWLINVMLPAIAKSEECEKTNFGGWLVKLSEWLAGQTEIDLTIVFPQCSMAPIMRGKVEEGYFYYGFYAGDYVTTCYSNETELQLKKILSEVKPDIVHIWGTEYIHSLEMFRAFAKPAKCVVSIQGIVSYYAKHFMADLPYIVRYLPTVGDIKRRNSLLKQKKSFEKRGKYEQTLLNESVNVIGRTDWDKAICQNINPSIQYYKCNEILRDSFYRGIWQYESCEKYSVFLSQGSYPIKGLHHMIEAMVIILKQFPQMKVYVAGNSPICDETLKQKIALSGYGYYLKRLISGYRLQENIVFLGALSEEEMCRQYLRSNVFILPSSIENSPNSLGEAMLLGVPCVAADVGGVKDMLIHNCEGYVYQGNASYMLAYYVMQMFENPEKAKVLAQEARKHAANTHHIENNLRDYLSVYNRLVCEGEENASGNS